MRIEYMAHNNFFFDAGVERKTMLFRFSCPAKALGLSIVSCIMSTAESQTNKYMHGIPALKSALALHDPSPFVQTTHSLLHTQVSGLKTIVADR